MTRIPSSKIVISTLVLGVLGSTAIYAQEKYSLKTPAGIAFSDFKGYEDWAVISSARTDEVLKVIVGNPTMIEAFKAGVPGNGQPFPDGSKVAKLQWKPKKSTEAPSPSTCRTSLHRLSSWRRTPRDSRKAADGDTRCSTTMLHPTSSPLIRAPRIADTPAMWP